MQIVNIDYWENDAILQDGDIRIYFAWDRPWATAQPPTLEDALKYIIHNYTLVDKYDTNG